METLFKGAGAVVSVLLVFVLRAYVVAKAWAWLAVPVFGVRPLSLAQAFAVNTLIIIVLPSSWSKPKEEASWRSLGKQILTGAAFQLANLGLAWVAKGLL